MNIPGKCNVIQLPGVGVSGEYFFSRLMLCLFSPMNKPRHIFVSCTIIALIRVMEKYNDQHIIESIRKREDVAFKYLQVKFQDSIRLMVMEKGGSREDARDVFSEGLIALIRLVDREDFKLNCKLGTLVYALCKKTWEQHLEKQTAVRNYHVRKVESTPDWDFSEESDQLLYQEVFWESFKKLEKVCQEILEGYLKEISPKDIAEQLGYSYGYIRKRKSMCHNFLMKMIQSHPTFRKIKQTELTLDIN